MWLVVHRHVSDGADDRDRAVLVLHLDLGQERRLATPLVVGPADADLAAVPAVGEQRVQGVVALAEEVGDVVGLDLGVVLVLGEAGSQLLVADAYAVQLGLVDPVRRREQRGAAYRPVDAELAAQPVRRTPARRASARRWATPRWHARTTGVLTPGQPTNSAPRPEQGPGRWQGSTASMPNEGRHAVYYFHARGADPGRDRRRRAGRDAAGPPARPRGHRVGGGRDPVRGVRRVADPGRHPGAVDRGPAARGRAGRSAGARGRRASRHPPAVDRPRAQRAPPRRLRRPDRSLGVGLWPDRGAEGPGRGGPRPRAGRALRGRGDRAARPGDRRAVAHLHQGRRGGAAAGRGRGRLRRVVRALTSRRTGPDGRGSGPIPTPGSASSPTSRPRPTS